MGKLRAWWDAQSGGRQLSFSAVSVFLFGKPVYWLLDKAAALAWEKLLERFMSPERAAMVKASYVSAVDWLGSVITDRLFVGAALMALAILILPWLGNAATRCWKLIPHYTTIALSRRSEDQSLAKLAKTALTLARQCMKLVEKVNEAFYYDIAQQPNDTEEQANNRWHLKIAEQQRLFRNAMAEYRTTVFPDAVDLCKKMHRMGYVEDYRVTDIPVNGFDIQAMGMALNSGANAIRTKLQERGLNPEKLAAD